MSTTEKAGTADRALISRYAERFAAALADIEARGVTAADKLDAYADLYADVLLQDDRRHARLDHLRLSMTRLGVTFAAWTKVGPNHGRRSSPARPCSPQMVSASAR